MVDLYDKFLIPEKHSKSGPRDAIRKTDFVAGEQKRGADQSAQSDQHLFDLNSGSSGIWSSTHIKNSSRTVTCCSIFKFLKIYSETI